MAHCYFCNSSLPEDISIYRTSTCPSCGKDLKICRNCKFYSPGSHWDCRETISEPVRDKENANFCDFFVLSISKKTSADSDKIKKARSQFDSLFND